MPETKPISLDIDLKKESYINNTPPVRYGDDVPLTLNVFDDGEQFELSSIDTISLAITRPDKQVIVLEGTKDGNTAIFNLGGSELEVPGRVDAVAQFYDVDGRISTVNFNLVAAKDPTGNGFKPQETEKTLIETVLSDGPLVIEEAKTVTNEAIVAALNAQTVANENKTRFLNAVDTVALRDSTYPNPTHGDTVRVTSTATTYRFVEGTGWVITDVYNPTAIDEVTTQLAEKAQQTDVDNLTITKAEKSYVETNLTALDTKINSQASGSPKGTYATLSELQSAFPTGNTNIYVVSADGNWYYWNGVAWTVGGIYQSTGISENSITPDKLSFIKAPYNLFKEYTQNLWVTSTGVISKPGTRYQSAVVPINNGGHYEVKTVGTHDWFTVSLSNSLESGTQTLKLTGGTSSTGNEQYSFVNDGNYSYLIVSVSTQLNVLPSLSVVETSMDITINNEKVLTLENFKNKASENMISAKTVDFIKGYYSEGEGAATPLTNGLMGVESGNYIGGYDTAKALIIKAENNAEYHFNVIGSHDRFYLGGAVGNTKGSHYEVIVHNNNLNSFSYKNINNYPYLVLTVSVTDQNPKVEVYGTLKIGEKEVLTEDNYSKFLNESNMNPQQAMSDLIVSPKQIKLIGDSITHGVGGAGFTQTYGDGEVFLIIDELDTASGGRYFKVNTTGECWANSLKDYLEQKFNCTVKNWGNRGMSAGRWLTMGHTDEDGIYRTGIEQLIEDTDDIVVCMIGTNDRTYDTNISVYLGYMQQLIDYIVAFRGKKLILLSPPPASVTNEETGQKFHLEDVNNAINYIALKNNLPCISLYNEFLNYCKYTNVTVDSLLGDGLHPNDEGYEVMYKIILKHLGFGVKRDGSSW